MARILLQEIGDHTKLYRDNLTGIAWVADGHSGIGHSCHANIAASGSVRTMKNLGYWDKDDRTVRSHGFIYNIDVLITSDEYDELARQHCRCQGQH